MGIARSKQTIRVLIVASVQILFIFLPIIPVEAQVQVSGRDIPEDCEPPSDDPDFNLQCDNYYLTHPRPRYYAPGTDPSNPAVFPADGLAGTAAAYSPKSDSVLIVAGKFVSDGNRRIVGVMAHPKTLAMKGPAFRIDQTGNGNGGSGTPRVVYAPDLEKFLVVWVDYRCGNRCTGIYGRFISADGVPMGSEFSIVPGTAFLADVEYDSTNKKFVVSYEFDNRVSFTTVDINGAVSSNIKLPEYFIYQGQLGLAVNTNINEYWMAYATVVSGGDTSKEDDRIYYSRVNAKTLQVVGQPIQLSRTRLGRLAVQAAHIAYSPKGGGAMVMWLERGREGIAGTWGRTIYDDGTLSEEYPVITPRTFIYSDGFASDVIEYNPWTESFFVFSGDWDGNAEVTEIDINGLIYGTEYAISPTSNTLNLWDKIKSFAVKTAHAVAYGTFNVSGTTTPYGSVTLASRNYSAAVGTSYASINAPGTQAPSIPPGNPVPPQPTDITTLPKLINQIYVWGLGISVLLALLMMILGGYYIMTAAGNAEQATKGKEYITSALIGVVIIFTAYLLLNEINPDLVNFNLDSLSGLNR